jgi:hypothetical protein
MRFGLVSFVVLAASFTLATAQAPKIDMTKQPPQPTSVNVLNFPETQAVEGSVAVTNLPAVQTVGGTVSVGNLPLDTDGALRVTSACPTAPPLQARYVDLLPNGPVIIQPGESFVSEIVDARGYTRFGIDLAGQGVSAVTEWTWSNINELFSIVADPRNGTYEDKCQGTPLVNGGQRFRLVCLVSGEQMRFKVIQWFDANPVTGLGVYLIP